jgi:hypothetical protein
MFSACGTCASAKFITRNHLMNCKALGNFLLAAVLIAAFALLGATRAQAQFLTTGDTAQTTLTYSSTNPAGYLLTQHDQGFNGVLYITSTGGVGPANANSNASGDYLAYHVVSVNTDNQVNYETWSCFIPGGSGCTYLTTGTPTYTISSRMQLDSDGHFALGSGSGGGIASDPTTGNTCIPYNANQLGACNVPTALNINTTGVISKYLGQNTAGSAIGIKVYEGSSTLTGNFGPYTIFTTPTGTSGYGANPQQYQMIGYISIANDNPGATCYAKVLYTDDTGPTSAQTSSFKCASIGQNSGSAGFNFNFRAVPGTPIQTQIFSTSGNVQYNISEKLILW